MSMPPRAAYLHVPFCRRRCGYCNFTVLAGRPELQGVFLEALETELRLLKTPRPVDTIFVGGGTPTELTSSRLARLGQLIRRWFPPAAGHEWSVEANPRGLTSDKVRALQASGVNRISLGVQSFDAGKLHLLQRDHRAPDIHAAYRLCRDHFASVSLDLMFAVPGESLEGWRRDLAQAIELQPDHLSVYGLTFEKGASFWSARQRGVMAEAAEELQRDMYQLAIDELTGEGWEHYEVSNFARPGHRCRHNAVYWTGSEYYAAGPGAARYVEGCREINHRSSTTYLRRMLAGQSAVAERETLTAEERAREQLVFRLRMMEGVDRQEFAEATGFSLDQLVAEPLPRFVELGLLRDDGVRVRLTREGLLVSDAIWPEFL